MLPILEGFPTYFSVFDAQRGFLFEKYHHVVLWRVYAKEAPCLGSLMFV